MGGRGSGSGFRAETGSGTRAERHRILTDIAQSIAESRGESGVALASRLSAAHGLAETWEEGAQALKSARFTDQGNGTWEFELGGGSHPSQIGAQILEEPERLDRPRSFSMIAWTGGDMSERRYFATRRQAERAARDMMLTRLGDWVRNHRRLHEQY